ncbi:hypothetical protein NC653_027730 [Populus alba x Populus x berolinensis]|uniref:Uncharacterized protein n=1 Tax=Populus alba x Populus x berolinensis TaxID=444605 RepID=A0AAD6M623_9ROSI|nr:hypothetical protein NC653_027730 [Populus alba x Populus x berolinensis]
MPWRRATLYRANDPNLHYDSLLRSKSKFYP